MLKVNRTSSASGGNGRMIIASAASTPSGTPSPERISERRSRGDAVAAMLGRNQSRRFVDTAIQVQLPGHGVPGAAALAHSLESGR